MQRTIYTLIQKLFSHKLAHLSGQVLNTSKLGESLGVAHTTICRYVDLIEQTFLARILMPYETNEKKRLIKSPKIYIRDNGILHQLLQIKDYNDLMSNPIFGASWEGLVVENLCSGILFGQPLIIINIKNQQSHLFCLSSRIIIPHRLKVKRSQNQCTAAVSHFANKMR